MSFSPPDLTYFLEIARSENLSRAAERLGVTQPTLTLSMKRLEDAVGRPLLLRLKTGVKLTRAGESLVIEGSRILDQWRKLQETVSRDTNEVRGRFTLGCHASVALYTLPYVLPDLLENNSYLEFRLIHDLSRKIAEDVISFKIDFGIVVNPIAHPDLVIKPILEDEVTLWTKRKPTELQNIKSGKGVLIFDPDLIQSQQINKQLRKSKIKFERNITSSNLEVISSLVASGAGIGVLPGRVATRIPAMNLMKVGGKPPIFKDRICLIYRADIHRGMASQAILKALDSLSLNSHNFLY